MTDARPLGLVVVVEVMVISLLFDDRRNPFGTAIRWGGPPAYWRVRDDQ